MENNSFEETILIYGLVVEGDLASIQKLKEKVAESNLIPVYQKLSSRELYIQEEGERFIKGGKE